MPLVISQARAQFWIFQLLNPILGFVLDKNYCPFLMKEILQALPIYALEFYEDLERYQLEEASWIPKPELVGISANYDLAVLNHRKAIKAYEDFFKNELGYPASLRELIAYTDSTKNQDGNSIWKERFFEHGLPQWNRVWSFKLDSVIKGQDTTGENFLNIMSPHKTNPFETDLLFYDDELRNRQIELSIAAQKDIQIYLDGIVDSKDSLSKARERLISAIKDLRYRIANCWGLTIR